MLDTKLIADNSPTPEASTPVVTRRVYNTWANGVAYVKLAKPIETHDGKLSDLKLDEPMGDVFFRYGQPFRIISETGNDGKKRVEFLFDPEPMKGYIEAMSGVDGDLLGQLKIKDLFACMSLITELMGDDEGN